MGLCLKMVLKFLGFKRAKAARVNGEFIKVLAHQTHKT